ncbi:MAG: hypothetical protein JNN07_02825 [Verrucomicrobiales bacterium]|nr:hypothetical protein [Verrucomicrobiales bacterium]
MINALLNFLGTPPSILNIILLAGFILGTVLVIRGLVEMRQMPGTLGMLSITLGCALILTLMILWNLFTSMIDTQDRP